MKKRIEVSSTLMRTVHALVLLWSGVTCADSWQDTTVYVDRLGLTAPDGVCIAIAQVQPEGVKKHVAGECDSSSLFSIGSITKTFTGVLLADAVLRDQVQLDTPIGSLLNQKVPMLADVPIRLVDLATHSSGLPRFPNNLPSAARNNPDVYRYYGERELLAFLREYELVYLPGERFEFSPLGMGLLGYLIGVAQGGRYESLLASRITDPLGMKSTIVVAGGEQPDGLLSGHDNMFETVPSSSLNALAASGAIYASLDDMVRYVQANLAAPKGPVGDKLELAQQPHSQLPEYPGEVGLGWMIRQVGDGRVFWHNSVTGGYRSFVAFVKGPQIGSVVLANAMLREIDFLGGHLLDSSIELPIIATVDPVGDYADYLGTYQFSGGFSLRLTSDGENLYGQSADKLRFTLSRGAKDEFSIEGSEMLIGFDRSKTGSIVGIILTEAENQRIGRKAGTEGERWIRVIPVETLERYVGTYRLSDEKTIVVIREGAQLFVQMTDAPRVPVYATSTTKFYFDDMSAEIEFNRSQAKPASSLTLHQAGKYRARRVTDPL
ncbi:MAG TPA: hypothetical protein DCM54_18390 [Gammaproteobacteria bacterium]|nr:hypothetical protein [Gammaproteobacteria bacterium]